MQFYVLNGALIVPSVESLEKWAETQDLKLCIQKDNVTLAGSQKINLESKIILDLFRRELNHSVQNRPGIPSGRPYRRLHG
jgi:long-chain acyl-CoA synthetase